MSSTPVFVSYVQENRPDVLRLVYELRRAGFSVWFDQDALPPGLFWRDEIRAAVRNHEYFIACFSNEYLARDRTYMNEELEIAIEEIRQRSSAPWFIPVLLSGEVPDRAIGAGRTLRDIQHVDLSDDKWTAGMSRLIEALKAHQSERGTEAADRARNRASPAHVPVQRPNVQLVQIRPISVEFAYGQAIRETNGNLPHAIPAFLGLFRNDPTGEPIGSVNNVGAKISFRATDFTITAMGLWVDGGEQISFAVGTTRRLWLSVMPRNGVPLTIEPSGSAYGRSSSLHHQMLRRINYRLEVLVFDPSGATVLRTEFPLELTL